jgi:hypothetical protein
VKRPLHLIIVSYPSRLDATLEEIAHTLARGANDERVIERAQEASDIRFHLRRWHLRDRDVRTMDLVGHGGGGRFKLGDELLFTSAGTGLHLAREWAPFLSARATLRLLGCSVAAKDEARAFDGRDLVRQLELRLGSRRRVLAPSRALFTIDYRPDGLSARARRALTGSTNPRRKHGGKGKEAGGEARQAQVDDAARR